MRFTACCADIHLPQCVACAWVLLQLWLLLLLLVSMAGQTSLACPCMLLLHRLPSPACARQPWTAAPTCDGVSGVHSHRVHVLNAAHDHAVVLEVTHHLKLKLLPTDQRLLYKDLCGYRRRHATQDTSASGAGHTRLFVLHCIARCHFLSGCYGKGTPADQTSPGSATQPQTQLAADTSCT